MSGLLAHPDLYVTSRLQEPGETQDSDTEAQRVLATPHSLPLSPLLSQSQQDPQHPWALHSLTPAGAPSPAEGLLLGFLWAWAAFDVQETPCNSIKHPFLATGN